MDNIWNFAILSEVSTVTLFEWVDGDRCYQMWSSTDIKMDDSKIITHDYSLSSDVRIVLRLYHMSYVYIINRILYTYYMYAYYIAVRREDASFWKPWMLWDKQMVLFCCQTKNNGSPWSRRIETISLLQCTCPWPDTPHCQVKATTWVMFFRLPHAATESEGSTSEEFLQKVREALNQRRICKPYIHSHPLYWHQGVHDVNRLHWRCSL